MTKKPICLALAVNHTGLFEAKHFGDADKYLIYKWADNDFMFISEEVGAIIKKHIKWIEDELNNNPLEFKLFTIKNGILKTVIRDRD